MSAKSSACRCGPGGQAKCEMGKCPHLRHICTPACGYYYSKYVGAGPVALMDKPMSTSGTVTARWSNTPTVSNPPRTIVTGEQRIKPPWEK